MSNLEHGKASLSSLKSESKDNQGFLFRSKLSMEDLESSSCINIEFLSPNHVYDGQRVFLRDIVDSGYILGASGDAEVEKAFNDAMGMQSNVMDAEMVIELCSDGKLEEPEEMAFITEDTFQKVFPTTLSVGELRKNAQKITSKAFYEVQLCM